MINKYSTDTKININLLVLFLFCLMDLILIQTSKFIPITISFGIIFLSIYILNSNKNTKTLAYLLFLLTYFCGIALGTFFLKIGIPKNILPSCILFLPIMFYFEDSEEGIILQVVLTIFSGILVFHLEKEIIQILIYVLVCITSVLLSRSSEEVNFSKDKYYDYYFSSKIKEANLKNMYRELIYKQDINIENAILNERNRISRDIHDSIGHLTSRAILQLGAMIVTEKNEYKKSQLITLKSTLSEGMNEVRKSLHNLQSESLNVKTSIENIISDFNFSNVNFKFSIDDDLSLKYKYSIIYIIKEALTNINKHSNATKVEISLIEMKNKIYIKIFDNGSTKNFSTEGMGIFSIRTRVNELGGSIEINKENGFIIFITLDK